MKYKISWLVFTYFFGVFTFIWSYWSKRPHGFAALENIKEI